MLAMVVSPDISLNTPIAMARELSINYIVKVDKLDYLHIVSTLPRHQEDAMHPNSKGISEKKSINWITYSCFDISRRLIIRTWKHWYDAQHYALYLHIIQSVKFDNREVECRRKNTTNELQPNNHKREHHPILESKEKYKQGRFLDQDLERWM